MDPWEPAAFASTMCATRSSTTFATRSRTIGCAPNHTSSTSTDTTRRSSSAAMPPSVCFPLTTAEVQIVRAGWRGAHGRPFVAPGRGHRARRRRGAARRPGRHRDHEDEPDLSSRSRRPRRVGRAGRDQPRPARAPLARFGLHFAPDPSSQQACSIGGNVANNSGGPHCLAYGVTSAHVLAIEVVLPDGSVGDARWSRARARRLRPARRVRRQRGDAGHRDRRSRCGSRPIRPRCARCSSTSTSMDDAGRVRQRDHRRRPRAGRARDDGRRHDRRGRGLRRTPATRPTPPRCSSSRSTACPRSWTVAVERVACDQRGRIGARRCGSRPTRPNGSCCGRAASPRSARSRGSRPTTTCTTPWCRALGWSRCCVGSTRSRPRDDLLVLNVFHAGDGNLHPLLVFDAREPGVLEQVHAAGEEIVVASLAAGGVLSGEHGIGIEKRDLMRRMFSRRRPRRAGAACARRSIPDGAANPGKVLPAGSRCGEVARIPDGRVGVTLADFAAEVGGRRRGPVVAVGGRTQFDVGGPVAGAARARCARPSASSSTSRPR